MRKLCAAIAGVVTAAAMATLPTGVPAQAETFADRALTLHNQYRADYGAAPLQWDAALAAGAQKWAESCEFTHSQAGGGYGENLYAGGGENVTVDHAMQAWMAEAEHYDSGNPVFSTATGHFTQVVWKSTTKVGVAVADCPAGSIFDMPSRFVVARYAPPGNVEGRFDQNVGRHV
ncbi:CAP family protein [Nocardia zapadnayensis]|uniref:CAP family protein n=1 Tax=Nocardia rhamnosiphila TaxID=426716 RepID=UPI00224788CA|nr:CAP family protein [Nocardia zapadnayensis]MCX0274259.1 CAP family protein [Nocardia zapadnayensis]